MATIPTANGTVDTSQLGFTLMHEHVFTTSPGVFQAWPHLWDAKAEVRRAVDTFRDLKAAGVDSIVDLTTVDLGRDVPLVVEVAKQVDLNIVMCTGVWRSPPRLFDRRNIDPVADLFVHDIEQGMQGTSVRAAIIKMATEPDVDDLNERMLRAGARAHRRTGVPISTHHFVATQCGLRQQDVFESEGVDLSRVVIGHSGDTADVDYLEKIIARGSYIGMDRFGTGMLLTTDQRVETVAELCRRGHADRMVLSHDTNVYMDAIPPPLKAERMPDWHFRHISDDILPALRERGVSEEQIQQMMVANPRAIFERQGAY